MDRSSVMVVGASAGGVEALRAFVGGLPPDVAFPVLVVLHVPAAGTSVLPAILDRVGVLPAAHAIDGETPRPGRIYVAPPDRHLLVRGEQLVLARGPRENGHRPAIDPLFRSASEVHGHRVIGVVLSGSLDDGSAGARVVAARGGIVAVQQPDDALHPSMPRSAIAAAAPDVVAPASELGGLIMGMVRNHGENRPRADTESLATENALAAFELDALNAADRPGRPAGFSCPDCQGTLFEFDEPGFLRFRCRVGHAWSSLSLLARQDSSVEHALWMALRNLEEKAALCRRLEESAKQRGSRRTAQRYGDTQRDALRAVTTLRSVLLLKPAPTGIDDMIEP